MSVLSVSWEGKQVEETSSHCCQGSRGWMAVQVGSGWDTVLKGMTHCPTSLWRFYIQVLPPCCVFNREFIHWTLGFIHHPPAAPSLAKPLITWEPVWTLHIWTSALTLSPLMLTCPEGAYWKSDLQTVSWIFQTNSMQYQIVWVNAEDPLTRMVRKKMELKPEEWL